MSNIHGSGSELLNQLLAERKRIHAAFQPGPVQVIPLPSQPMKPLSERIAEAKKLRGTVSESKFHMMLNAIYVSARNRGEYVVNESFLKSPPEITSPGELTIEKIQTVVAEHYNLTREEMLSLRQVKRVILPRHIAMYLSTILIPHNREYISKRFGFDHTAITHAVQKIERMISEDAAFAEKIEALKKSLVS